MSPLIWAGRNRSRQATKSGPGRMPHRKSKGRGTVYASGAGSIMCEVEILRLIHRGSIDAARRLYEANEARMFNAGTNKGLRRLRYWYQQSTPVAM